MIYLIVAIAILAIILGPIVVILALNTLFGLNIEINMYTWASALILSALVGARNGK